VTQREREREREREKEIRVFALLADGIGFVGGVLDK